MVITIYQQQKVILDSPDIACIPYAAMKPKNIFGRMVSCVPSQQPRPAICESLAQQRVSPSLYGYDHINHAGSEFRQASQSRGVGRGVIDDGEEG